MSHDLDERLRVVGQPALADRLARLRGEARENLACQVEALDLELVHRLVGAFVRENGAAPAPPALDPPEVARLPRGLTEEATEHVARGAGEDLLASGRVGVVLLAGGQGTRLGFAGPKGAFPFSAVTRRTLFAHHAATVAAIRRRYGCALPWYLLTSPQNDATTRAFFAQHDFFGLAGSSVRFIVQGTMPAVDCETGELLLRAPDRLALAPDGHGGLLRALRMSGALEALREEGVETLFTFQVDNPLTRVARPGFLGRHALAEAEMSSIVIGKDDPDEPLALVARQAGRTTLIEYSDVPAELAERRDPDGDLTYWAGSINVHAIQCSFVARLTGGDVALPFHRALKKVPFMTADDREVYPDAPNAVKFETFVFDAVPLAERTVMVEADRAEEFSPIKNADGADSPATCRRDLTRRAARWLAGAGCVVPRGADGEPRFDIEIDPGLALDADELAERLAPGTVIEGPTALGPERVVAR